MAAIELKKRRERLGMTQQQLADALGVPRNTVARWERGELSIQHPTIIDLALKQLSRKR